MAKKAKSGPMMEILNRISAFSHDGQPEFQVLVFDEETILKRPIDEWPLCEALISFFSTGFPLRKAQAYASLRRPHVFNNLEKQELLFDRRRVYAILESVGVPVPKHVCFDASDKSTTVEDSDEWLQINGVRINKPLVEKPISGEDHNIYIYYPRSQGGGSKRLFRKVGDRSAQFYPDEHKTRIGDGNSYIYEELLQTEGTDVKVYAVGPEYAHAEARKSPVVDGRVMRNVRGKEMRYPVILSNVEKTIARKVVSAFGQFVCGFDILRSNGGAQDVESYVCDVNGWSSVKDSPKFWDDAANLLRMQCLQVLAPYRSEKRPPRNLLSRSTASADFTEGGGERTSSTSEVVEEPTALLAQLVDPQKTKSGSSIDGSDDESSEEGEGEGEGARGEAAGELLCVVAFIRHGDRTPKQKLKFKTDEPSLLEMISPSSPYEERKIKTTDAMEQLLVHVEAIVERLGREAAAAGAPPSIDGMLAKFSAVRQVLTAKPFHGINRKVQIKPTAWRDAADDDDQTKAPAAAVDSTVSLLAPLPPAPLRAASSMAAIFPRSNMAASPSIAASPAVSRRRTKDEIGSSPHNSPEVERRELTDAHEEAHPSPQKPRQPRIVPTAAQFVLKWGGELTPLGQMQATRLGAMARFALYPGEEDGVLRLHASYRHDLKIYSSDEGRVQMTAAAFTKGFLALEGQLTPILASLVSKHTSITKMLDETPEAGREKMNVAKDVIHRVLTSEVPLSEDDGNLAQSFVQRLSMTTPEVSAEARLDAQDTRQETHLPQDTPQQTGPDLTAPGTPQDTSQGTVEARDRRARDSREERVRAAEEEAAMVAELTNFSHAAAEAEALAEADAWVATHAPQDVCDAYDAHGAPSMGVGTASDQLTSTLEVMMAPGSRPAQFVSSLRSFVFKLKSSLARSVVTKPHPMPSASTSPKPSDIGEAARSDEDFGHEDFGLGAIGHPRAALERLNTLVCGLTEELAGWVRVSGASLQAPQGSARVSLADTGAVEGSSLRENSSSSLESAEAMSTYQPAEVGMTPTHGESIFLLYNRWAKLQSEFYQKKKDSFDTTKIPDLYDNASYDMIHNQHLGLKGLPDLYAAARTLAWYVVPQEYGTQSRDKVAIGACIGAAMLAKLRTDMMASTTIDNVDHFHGKRVHRGKEDRERHVRTRLYFTSESHIYSLFNVLRWGSSSGRLIFSNAGRALFTEVELGYLTHIVFRVLAKHEHKRPMGLDGSVHGPDNASRYVVQLLLSPGIDHHHVVCNAASSGGGVGLSSGPIAEALQDAKEAVLASSPDLTLDEIDKFLAEILATNEEAQRREEATKLPPHVVAPPASAEPMSVARPLAPITPHGERSTSPRAPDTR